MGTFLNACSTLKVNLKRTSTAVSAGFLKIFSLFSQNRANFEYLHHYEQQKIQMKNIQKICNMVSLQLTVFPCKFDLPQKRNLMPCIINFVFKLYHELPNDF